MKKLLTIMVLALALCLLCGAAMAEVDFSKGYETNTKVNPVTIKPYGTEITVDGVNYATTGKISWKMASDFVATLTYAKEGNCGKEVTFYVQYYSKADKSETAVKPVTIVLVKHEFAADPLTNEAADELIKPATCFEEGKGKFLCNNCKKLIEMPIPKLEHHFIEKVLKAATCDKDGTAILECEYCQTKKGDEYALKGAHNWVTTFHAPECKKGVKFEDWQKTGWSITQCTICSKYSKLLAIDANKTTNDIDAKVDTYDNCKQTYATLVAYNAATKKNDNADPIDGHEWSIWRYVDATCVKDGYKYRYCTRCDQDDPVKGSDFTAAEKLAHPNAWKTAVGPQWAISLRDESLTCVKPTKDDFGSVLSIYCTICGGTENHIFKAGKDQTEKDIRNKQYKVTAINLVGKLTDAHFKWSFTVEKDGGTDTLIVDGAHIFDYSDASILKTKNAAGAVVNYKTKATCAGGGKAGYSFYLCAHETKKNDGSLIAYNANVFPDGKLTHYYKAFVVDPAPEHKWGEWKTIAEPIPGVEDSGWWHRVCSVCGEGLDNHGNQPPCDKHTPSWEVVTPATCTTDGEQKKICSVCKVELPLDEDETTVIKAPGHVWNTEKDWTIKTEPTCTTDGVAIKECTVCHAYENVVLKADGHKVELVKGEAATHTKEGKKDAYKCSVCGKLFEDKEATKEVKEADLVIAKTPEHDWKNAKVEIVKEATCSEAGKKLYTCECGATKTEGIPMIDHTPVEIPAVAPTCKTPGATAGEKCSVCGKELKAPVEIPVDLTKHVWGEVIETKAPTCEKAGAGLKVCSECKTSEEVVIPAKGHDWGEWEVTTPATLEKDGEETRVCKNDATHKETRPVKFVPTAPAKYEVKDLDYTNPVATGSVELDPETKALTKAYARVTFFVANGDCMIQIVDVNEAGSFTAGAIGNFTHVSVIIVDDADAYGADEAIEHAHGNGGIEL